jgi:hypothetical protein
MSDLCGQLALIVFRLLARMRFDHLPTHQCENVIMNLIAPRGGGALNSFPLGRLAKNAVSVSI